MDAWGLQILLQGWDRRLRAAWLWLRFGRITEHVKAVDGGVVSEIEYRGWSGRRVGYWAYGFWDPRLPYRGE